MKPLDRFAFKRLFDVFASLAGLGLAGPVMLVVALMIRLDMGAPVVFRQTRPGHRGIPFVMYKFRTMTRETDPSGRFLPDAQRLTGLGSFLRRTSLDELPELLNVLKGEMSIVGPRPLLMEYLDRYTKKQARRHEVKPGITGWAQVNGRNAIGWEEKFGLDVWYVDHWSLWLDLKIVWMTLFKVFNREGINQEKQATVEKFKGEGRGPDA